eukprot:g11055.t1
MAEVSEDDALDPEFGGEVREDVGDSVLVLRTNLKPSLVFPDVEAATMGTADALCHISRCAGEHLLDVESLLGSWDGCEVG